MEVIKTWLKTNNVYPKVDFSDKEPHLIKILNAKIEKFTDKNNEDIEGVKFLVEESGEMKTILTTSTALLLKLRECEEGEYYKIQMKFIKSGNNPIRTYDVWKIEEDKEVSVEVDVKEEDIPVVEDSNEETMPEDFLK